MKPTVGAERKFSIYSQFLDTTLRAEEERLPGESIEEGEMRLLKQLENTAARLRREANPGQHEDSFIAAGIPTEKFKQDLRQSQSAIPIISKDKEKIEIAIDNAQTTEDLKRIKAHYEFLPASLIPHYNKKLEELANGK